LGDPIKEHPFETPLEKLDGGDRYKIVDMAVAVKSRCVAETVRTTQISII